jgi:hypothetical protein
LELKRASFSANSFIKFHSRYLWFPTKPAHHDLAAETAECQTEQPDAGTKMRFLGLNLSVCCLYLSPIVVGFHPNALFRTLLLNAKPSNLIFSKYKFAIPLSMFEFGVYLYLCVWMCVICIAAADGATIEI